MLQLNVRILVDFNHVLYIGWIFFCTSACAGCSITGKVQGKNSFQGQENVREFYFELAKEMFL